MSNREMYVDVLKSRLNEWNDRIDMLRVLVGLARQETRDEVKERMDHLRTKRDEFASKVKDFEETGEEANKAVKQGMERITADLRETFDEVKSTLAS